MRSIYLGLLGISLLVAATIPISSAQAIVIFDDGMTHTIDAMNSFPRDAAFAVDSPSGDPTTIILVDGGEVATAPDFISDLIATGASRLEVTGGVVGASINLQDTATATISGGVGQTVIGMDSSYMAISGGTFLAGSNVPGFGDNVFSARFFGNASADVLGGDFSMQWELWGQSNVRIRGGMIGNLSDPIDVYETATLVLYGIFNLPHGEITAQQGTLTGTLSDGSPIDVLFGRDAGATIRLMAVPEPSSAVLVMLGLVGIAWRGGLIES